MYRSVHPVDLAPRTERHIELDGLKASLLVHLSPILVPELDVSSLQALALMGIKMVDRWDELFEQTQQDSWWMPQHVVRVDRPEIRYTYEPGGSHRFSMVTRVDPNLAQYDDLVAEVISFQAPMGQSDFMIAAPSYSQGLETALLAAGFSPRGVADCWSIDVTAIRPPIPDHIEVKRVESEQGMRDMDSVQVESFEHAKPNDDETIRRELKGCVGPEAQCRRYVAYSKASGRPLSSGAFNVFSELGVGFMWGGSTIADARGQGVYSAVLTTRMKDAQSMGLARIGLYAIRETSGPIVEKQGFEKHGRVNFWTKKFEAS